MRLDDAFTVIATRYSSDRKERWIAATSPGQGFSIQRAALEEQEGGQNVYRIDRDAPRISHVVARQFDDWNLDWNDGEGIVE